MPKRSYSAETVSDALTHREGTQHRHEGPPRRHAPRPRAGSASVGARRNRRRKGRAGSDRGSAGRLQGKVAIVTGAARGIGLAIAEALVAQGAQVTLADWLADEVRAQATKLGPGALAVPTDVGDAGQVRRLVAATVERFGRLDVMVANAAVQAEIPFLDLTETEFDRVIRVNLKGTFLCGQAAARHMVETGTRGAIINLSSVNAVVAHPVLVHYAASKGGIAMLTKGMAVALAPHGIRVNAIGPGTVNTPINANFFGVPGMIQRFLMRTPLGRIAEPEEIARIAVFLASDDASYVTGTTIYADGGRLALNGVMPPAP
ncbi:MAG TPA: glucose 1-dehydrogenase [Methylomirabilota bacterium]|nr:glucose 1-dehydrogenase [Methylomirabilota bacterium]